MTKMQSNSEYGQMNAVSAYPPEFTAQWYRLHALKHLHREHMEAMLSFLAGYDPVGWDKAYESVGSLPEITVHPDDPDYREDEKEMPCIHPGVFSTGRPMEYCQYCRHNVPAKEL